MKSFKQYIDLLQEDRKEFLEKKYKDISSKWEAHNHPSHRTPERIIWYWTHADPTPNHKYLDWILRQYSKHDFRQEDGTRVNMTLIKFERLKSRIPQKDINQYHHLSDLIDAIDEVDGIKQEELKNISHEGADKIFDDDGVTVYRIDTVAAARFYGDDTEWCTKAKDVFERYSRRGPLYVVFCKDLKGNLAKYLFHFQTKQFMDVKDRKVDLYKLVEMNPALRTIRQFQNKDIALTQDFDGYIKHHISDYAIYFQDPRFSAKHIDKILDHTTDDTKDVRYSVMSSPNIIKRHVDKALKDPVWFIKFTTLHHLSRFITKEQLEHLGNDNNTDVSTLAHSILLSKKYADA